MARTHFLTKMLVVAGEDLVTRIDAQRAALPNRGDALRASQEAQSRAGIRGAELVLSNYGWSVRYDSGLQNWGLLASARAGQLDGTLEAAENFARDWVSRDPERRYAWRRIDG